MDKKCDECGKTEEVVTITVIWATWGRNAFDFNWAKYDNKEISLCDKCENEQYVICGECGAGIDNYNYGRGYLPEEEYLGDSLCPECAGKKGFKCQVHIGLPKR